MTSVRGWLLGVMAWLLVVLVGSSLVWVVISRAGQGVAPSPGSGDPGQVAAGAAASSPGAAVTPAPSTTSRPTLRPEPSDSARPSGPPSPRAGTTDGPDDSSPSAAPPASAPSASTSGARAVRRTWSGVGGTVVAECRGETIRMMGAQPDGGFAVEVLDRGPHQVKVEFRGRGDEHRESQVESECEAGTPHFSAENKDD
ncbi:hypothetical protein EKO23_12655 [Nocardioides guangzhouensis]|uniref:Uncharacterized protein n=1 Tax=Nocardioides guangzhouensis TaxID=2497878 RepID=A0A4V1XZ31_9ACTN|nr:hypothetical protein [Nocardioides guangzhouensis]RYP85329.1 hypothetical protein EKO23_12655 [Nocardioides guangzhouensis]